MEKILVTGGAGFIGSHLVDELINLKHKVRVLDIFEEQVHQGKKPDYLNKKCEYLTGDIRNPKDLKKALEDISVVFHLAAQVGVGQSMYQIEKYVGHNTLGTAVLMEYIISNRARLNIRKVIVASSMSIYGEGAYRCDSCGPSEAIERNEAILSKKIWEYSCPKCSRSLRPVATGEEKSLRSNSIYAISKKDQEEIVLNLGKAYKLPAVALRFFNVYGPRQSLSNPYTGVCAIFQSRIKNGNPLLIYEDGLQTRDFVSVRDVVAANILAMDSKEADYQYFNVGTGKPTSVLDIAKTLSRLYGKEPEIVIKSEYRMGDIRHCFADISKIEKIGFKPSVSFDDGMREMVEWGKRASSIDKVNEADRLLAKMKLKI